MARFTALLLLAILLAAGMPHIQSVVTCGQVDSYLAPCFDYAKTSGVVPGGCCTGVRGLNSLAVTTPDRQTACTCLKSLVGTVPGLKPDVVAGIPSSCGVNIPYAIKTSTDCSKVK